MDVGESTVNAALQEPKWTALACIRLAPAIVICVPPAAGPELAETDVSTGGEDARAARPLGPPGAIGLTPVRPVTATGTGLAAVPPSPSCPWPFAPQAITVPSPSSARLCSSPPEMAG